MHPRSNVSYSRDEIIYCKVASYHSTMLEVTEMFRTTQFVPRMFVNADCVA